MRIFVLVVNPYCPRIAYCIYELPLFSLFISCFYLISYTLFSFRLYYLSMLFNILLRTAVLLRYCAVSVHIVAYLPSPYFDAYFLFSYVIFIALLLPMLCMYITYSDEIFFHFVLVFMPKLLAPSFPPFTGYMRVLFARVLLHVIL